MNKGARFHNCDFQVHTPRDINWKGAGAVTSEERKQYAEEFVVACRTKGLQAVAITDHHDFAFFRYIKEAALSETDEMGQPLSEQARLVVFPGLELTLAVPCQALLILDADFPVDFLDQVLQALSIAAAPDGAEHNAEVKRLEHIKTLEDLYEELEKREFLRGRFIVLPHVGESGNFSMLRKGFATAYKNMPCVGGYIDGSVDQFGEGRRTILNGANKEYGNKALAVFQTSDNRSRNFAELGTHTTWVKWSRPTAEALRQACLARDSRLAQTAPMIPSIRITNVEVSNSKFLGPINLELNPQYNAIIGGRGTGKSTILEYIRWALCDQSATDEDQDDLAEFERRRQMLIENTLIPLDATVEVSVLLDNVLHVIRRKSSGEISLKIGSGEFEICSEENVRSLLPIRAYSQKQLSAVGARIGELRRFVHAPITSTLEELEGRLHATRADLRTAFDKLQRFRQLQSDLEAYKLERQSLKQRTDALRAGLKGLSDADKNVIDVQAVYASEKRLLDGLDRDVDSAKTALLEASRIMGETIGDDVDLTSATQNGATVKQATDAVSTWMKEAKVQLDALLTSLEPSTTGGSLESFHKAREDWNVKRNAHQVQYDQAKTRAAAHEETLKQITALEERLAEINKSSDEKTAEADRLGKPDDTFAGLRTVLGALLVERANTIEVQCARLTPTPEVRLRASLRKSADTALLADRIKQVLRGSKARTERVDDLLEKMAQATTPIAEWELILDELSALAQARIVDDVVTPLPGTPRLDAAGFTTKEKGAIARQLDSNAWLELLLTDLKDLPVFEYKVGDGNFIPFQDASPGQQATALLSILLLQDGPPLLIDQPEDDLNMKVISEIVETLWKSKAHRQLIFATLNAILVVNGDAELVVCCDYRTTSTESGGQIKAEGTIDVEVIKNEITEVMEGGVDAFKLRHQKYGF